MGGREDREGGGHGEGEGGGEDREGGGRVEGRAEEGGWQRHGREDREGVMGRGEGGG